MDFLRLHLPGLHQALRGALDSLNAFVSYLIGDTVPTVAREPQAAEELGELAAGDPGKVVEEEAQEGLKGLGSGQSKGVEAPKATIRCQEGSLAGEQTWGWRADSSARPQGERQDTGSRKAAEGARSQEPSVPWKPEAGSGVHRDRSSNRPQELWEQGEEEVSSGELLRTYEQEERKGEVVRAAEPGMARGVESQPTWHKEPEGNAGTDGQNVAKDSKETDWVAKEVAAETDSVTKEVAAETDLVTKEVAAETDSVTKEVAAETDSVTKEVAAETDWVTKEVATETDTVTKDVAAETDSVTKDVAAETYSVTKDVAAETDSVTKDVAAETDSVTKDVAAETYSVTKDVAAETYSVTKDVAVEVEGFGAREADEEEERMVSVKDSLSARAQGTQCPGAEPEDWAVLGREAWTVSGREEAESLGIQEAEYRPDSGDNIAEATGRLWVLEEACKGDQQDEPDEKREAQVRLLPQTLETERTEQTTEGQLAGREAVGGQEIGDSLEDDGRQDSAMGSDGGNLEERMQAEESPREEGSYLATEAMLVLAKEVTDKPDWEESPEARPEELFMGEKIEAAQMRAEVLKAEVAEGQDSELMRGSQTLTPQLEEGQEGQEETRRAPDPSPEGTLCLEEYPRPVEFTGPELEAWGSWRRDADSRNIQKVKADVEAGEAETATGPAVEIQTEGGQEAQHPETPGWGAEEALASIAVNQELEGSQGAETGPGQSVGGSELTENKASEGEAAELWGADGTCGKDRLEEEAPSPQDREDTQTTSSLAAEIIVGIRTVGAEEELRWEAGIAPERGAGGGTELEDATERQSGQGVGLEGSAEEEVSAYEIQESGGTGEEEEAAMGTSVMAEGLRGVDGVTGSSQAEKAEGLLGHQRLLEEEAGRAQSTESGDQSSKREPQDVEDAVSEGQSAKIQEADPEALEDSSGLERQQSHQIPTLAVPESASESAEATAGAPGGAHGSWNEVRAPAGP
ncbi:apolipoprotein B receptor isoform X1 [Acomys russatus]|uniref:apolipoprotein B receptor isoform X1 n=1 Tax=Acomys russatus TaxID=60746 RepID=UPI0021E2A2E6|nr:apolipoprotein B receptor isoform X1 [Acomys russatus]